MPTYAQSITDASTLRVTAAFGQYPSGGYHGGLDTVHNNYLAFAPTAGTIVKAYSWKGGISGEDSWGNHIVVQTSPNTYWLAAHFQSQTHSVGEIINKGDFIGVQGQTGNVTGTHTHWEYWVGGYGTAYRTNPSTILNIPNAVGTYDVTWNGGEQPIPPTPEVYTVSINPNGGTIRNKKLKIVISTDLPSSDIYYTIDGTDPDISSNVYSSPFEITFRKSEKFTLKAIAISDTSQTDIVTANFKIIVGMPIWAMVRKELY